MGLLQGVEDLEGRDVWLVHDHSVTPHPAKLVLARIDPHTATMALVYNPANSFRQILKKYLECVEVRNGTSVHVLRRASPSSSSVGSFVFFECGILRVFECVLNRIVPSAFLHVRPCKPAPSRKRA